MIAHWDLFFFFFTYSYFGHSVAFSCVEGMVFVLFYLFFLLFCIVYRGHMGRYKSRQLLPSYLEVLGQVFNSVNLVSSCVEEG